MKSTEMPRILVVDDEEAILETMSFTFMDVYEVLTASDARQALELIDANAPVAVVITDQRMPEMTGVELLKEVYERHPDTVRIILTGFADSEDAIRAINDGHVYAYVNKPWEPDELKATVRRAVDHFELTCENRRLVQELRGANSIMNAVMDRLDVGAIAVDQEGIVRAANAPARTYLELEGKLVGLPIGEVLSRKGLESLCASVEGCKGEVAESFEDHDLRVGGHGHRVRVTTEELAGPEGESLGRVILFKEISHEPLRRRFEEILGRISRDGDESVRESFEQALDTLAQLAKDLDAAGISSPGMAVLAERVSRSQTALQNWLDVDDMLAREDYPDAQLLLDRIRMAAQRWPQPEKLPDRVNRLIERVEAYYESGENPREGVL